MPYTIAELRAEYDKADTLAQEVNNFLNEAGIPAINELRYAGHHLLKALDDQGGVADQQHIEQAMGHARRASYEATEAGIVLAVEAVKTFRDDFRTITIADLVPDYAPRIQNCNQGLRLVEQGRQPGFNRDADHSDRIEVFRKLRSLAEDLTAVRDEANKRLDDKRATARQWIIGTLLAILAILVTIVLGVPPLLK